MSGWYHVHVEKDLYTHLDNRAPLPERDWSGDIDDMLHAYIKGHLSLYSWDWKDIDRVSLAGIRLFDFKFFNLIWN